MQTLLLSGNLAADCEVFRNKAGEECLRFVVAANDHQSEKPTYYSCTMRKSGVCDKLKKGRFVSLVGLLKVSQNEKDGKTYTNLGVWVMSIDVPPVVGSE